MMQPTNPPIGSQHCDKHESAWAKARIILPSLGTLYACGHCAKTWELEGDYFIEYEAVTV